MTARQQGREGWRVHTIARAGAHLAALSALAFAQPLFDILGKNPEFFAVRESSAGQIVLFALALTLLPPAALLGAEVLVSLVSRTAAWVLHLVFVAGLVGVIVLHALTKADALSGFLALVAAALVGVAAADLYRRVPAVQTFMTVLVAAPVVFLVLFLFNSPVSKLVFPQSAQATTVPVGSRTPVVLIVFDEFPTVALMDRAERVDAARFPNFASLARNATWFRSATTVQPHTEHAVPAILTGRLPKQHELPIFADHRQNIFTFLGGSYRLRVAEALTHLCPPKLCNKKARKTQQLDSSASDETGSLTSGRQRQHHAQGHPRALRRRQGRLHLPATRFAASERRLDRRRPRLRDRGQRRFGAEVPARLSLEVAGRLIELRDGAAEARAATAGGLRRRTTSYGRSPSCGRRSPPRWRGSSRRTSTASRGSSRGSRPALLA